MRARRLNGRVVALLALLAAAWLAIGTVGGLSMAEVGAGALAVAIGFVAARAIRRPLSASPPARPGERPGDGEMSSGDPLAVLLDVLHRHVAAERLVLWQQGEDGQLQPVAATGPPPPAIPAAGNPLAWAVDQGRSLRLEPRPAWAVADAVAVPIPPLRKGLALTIEAEDPDIETSPLLRDAPRLIAGILELQEREGRAAATTARLERLMAFLRELPGRRDPRELPGDLARAAAEILGGTGAVVASWDEASGRVLGRWGSGGGPAAGHYIGILGGDLALAARAGATLRRGPGHQGGLPLAGAGERWNARPGYTTVVPLVDAGGGTRGVLGVWGETAPDEGGVGLLEALGPLLALQLRHSTDIVRFRQRAHEDALTSLPNRAALDEQLTEVRHRFHRYRRPVALMILDIDHFKSINDTWGHQAGDAVLERLADVLRTSVREVDFPARFGGEELVVLMPETMRREAGEAAERVRAAIERTAFEWNGRRVTVTVSVGVTACPECVDDPAELLRGADKALYVSKRRGRNRVTVAEIGTSGG